MNPITHGSILAVFFQANAAERQEGLSWYGRAELVAQDLAARYLGSEYGPYTHRAAAVIAVLSPNNRWERNISDAEALLKAYCYGSDIDAVKVSTFGKNKAKAIAILNGAEPLDVLGGRKVRAFYECIIGVDSVCVDGHAYSIWAGQRVPTTRTPKISDKLYDHIAQDYRLATKQINSITGESYLAQNIQAITWVTWRNIIKGGAINE